MYRLEKTWSKYQFGVLRGTRNINEMSNDLVYDHLVSNRGSEPECSVGSSWKMENILRLGLTSNSLIPMPKSGKFSSSSSENDNSKLSKTEQNKLRLILQYGTDSTDHSAVVDCTDDADKEKKVTTHGTRIPVNSFGSRNQRFEVNKVTMAIRYRMFLRFL